MLTKINAWVEKILEKEKNCWLFSIAGVLIIYFILYRFTTVRWAVNDEGTIINSIIHSAQQSGLADKGFMYINFLLGLPLSYLYKWFTNIPWYDLYSILIIAFSIIVISKSLLNECKKKSINAFMTLFIWIASMVIILLQPMQQIQFTTTAAITGSAALLHFVCLDRSQKVKRTDTILVCILMYLCYFQRFEIGYIIIAFFSVLIVCDFAVCIIWKKPIDNGIKYNIKLAVFLGATLLLATFLNNSFNRQDEESAEFVEYNALRVQYMDYNKTTYQDNPELYESVGWDESLYDMVRSWYFMDDRYNADALKKILAGAESGFVPIEETTIRKMVNSWGSSGITESEIGQLSLLLMVIFICIFIYRHKITEEEMKGLGIIAGSLIMCMYFCIRGRFLYRIVQAIFIPVDLILIILIIHAWEKIDSLKIKIGKVICILGGIVLMGGTLKDIFDQGTQRMWTDIFNSAVVIKDYCHLNDENIYIYGPDLSITDPIFYKKMSNTVYNCYFWGGTSMFSKAYYDNLEKCGLENLTSDVWFEDNIYYLVVENYWTKMLCGYLDDKYDGVDYDVVDELGYIKVIKFKMAESS